MISVVLPCFNAMEDGYFTKICDLFLKTKGLNEAFELIVIDGGSIDGTIDWLKQQDKLSFYELPNSTRAGRLNLGIKKAKHEAVLLHHPRSIIDLPGLQYLIREQENLNWAAFQHQFDVSHPFLKYISWYSNQIRVLKKHMTYLDHCIFFKKSILNQPISDIAIFEDTALSYQLQHNARPQLLPYIATTSAVRFTNRGIYRQFFMNQMMKCLYHAGVSPARLNYIYESKLNLNQENT